MLERIELIFNEFDHHRIYTGRENKKVCLAIYEIIIAHKRNDYFEGLSNDLKYHQLEVIYYQALNVALKGDVHKASEPFRKLVLEDDRLVQYQNKDVFYRVEAYYNKENPL
ncbi:hypothetical protein QK906_06215 [Streptococcus thermophilus]|uniref:hypothetical protein n=1 Tax=Streptococcus thermophilus TaxID=1308 RepID=UPI001E2E5769|nr:hypothetical protein [Streptococcus thermophilus]